jgi:predicted aconitase
LKLATDEERMLAGELGTGVQRAMELLIAVGEAYEAEKLIDISSSHILSPEMQFWNTGQLSRWARELVAESVEGAAHFKVPVTINPIFLEPSIAESLGYPESYIEEMLQSLSFGRETYARLGVIPAYTCCPFYIYPLRQGEHSGGAESLVVLYNNSVLGVRVNRESGPTALATALTGKTPLYGMHLPENRHGQNLIVFKDDLDAEAFTYAHYNALSYYVGKKVVDKIPVFLDLPQNISITQLKYLCAPLGVSAGIPMFHAVGITPEAPTVEAALGSKKPEMIVEVGKKEIDATFEELCSATKPDIDYVFLGCPHVTITEIKEIAALLRGKKIKSDILFIIGTTEPLRLLAQKMGLVDIIQDAGGKVVAGMCSAGSFLRRGVPKGFNVGVAATNAAKAAHQLKAGGVQVWFGTMQHCIDAAIKGKWEAV